LKTNFAGWTRLHQIELRALAALGRDEEVERKLAILLEGASATALVGLNMELNAHGYGEYAKQITRSSLALLSDEPVEARDDYWKFRRGSQLATLGRDDEALAQLAEILPDSPRYLDARQVVGEIAARSADRVTALRVSAEMDAVRQEGLKLYYQAIIAAELGERDRAVALLRRSQNPVRAPMHRELSFPALQGYPPFEELERPRGP